MRLNGRTVPDVLGYPGNVVAGDQLYMASKCRVEDDFWSNRRSIAQTNEELVVPDDLVWHPLSSGYLVHCPWLHLGHPAWHENVGSEISVRRIFQSAYLDESLKPHLCRGVVNVHPLQPGEQDRICRWRVSDSRNAPFERDIGPVGPVELLDYFPKLDYQPRTAFSDVAGVSQPSGVSSL